MDRARRHPGAQRDEDHRAPLTFRGRDQPFGIIEIEEVESPACHPPSHSTSGSLSISPCYCTFAAAIVAGDDAAVGSGLSVAPVSVVVVAPARLLSRM